MSRAARYSCPACLSGASTTATIVDADRVWSALEQEFQIRVPHEMRVQHAPAGHWPVAICRECGLEFFAGAREGTAQFYALLTSSPRYYEMDRWEFRVVRQRVARGDKVLDIGCGEGAFLASLHSSVRRTGIDHSQPALKELIDTAPAVEALAEGALEHATRRPHEYDVVTAFQILEHVEQPRELLRAARRLVHSEGSVYVSVPHLDRSGRAAFEALDHPPHHLTRWRLEQLEVAAEAEDLIVASSWLEPPDVSLRLATLSQEAEERVGRLPPRMRSLGVRGFRRIGDTAPVRSLLVRRGYYRRRGVTGHTLLVALRPAQT